MCSCAHVPIWYLYVLYLHTYIIVLTSDDVSPPGVCSGPCDPFCVLRIDNEEVARYVRTYVRMYHMYVCMYVCMYVRMYVCMSTVCTYVCVCMSTVCMYVCVYTYLHIYVYINPSSYIICIRYAQCILVNPPPLYPPNLLSTAISQ